MFSNTSRICSWNQTLHEKISAVVMIFLIRHLTLIIVITCGTLSWHIIIRLCLVVHDSKDEKGLYIHKEKSHSSTFNDKGFLVCVFTEITYFEMCTK